MVYSLVPRRRQHSFAETSAKTLEQRRFYNLQIHSHYVMQYPFILAFVRSLLPRFRWENREAVTVRKTTLCSPLQKTSHMLYWKAEKKIPEQNKLGHNISSYCLSLYHVI